MDTPVASPEAPGARDGTPDRPAPTPTHRRGNGTLLLFSITIFLAAALVFLIQPMIARKLLPLYGGSPSVWNTSLVFFQAALLAGYAFAHASSTFLGRRRQLGVQIAVLAVPLLFLPLALPDNAAPDAGSSPAMWLLYVLAITVGVPYFAVATASPILQRWFSQLDHPQAHDPYFLYAAGNAGSLLGLLAYPAFVEPAFDLDDQSLLWAVGYALFVVAMLGCAVLLLHSSVPAAAALRSSRTGAGLLAASAPPLSWRQRGSTIGLAAIPSAMIVGVTTYLTTDVASVPFLWALPLALYLLTFVLAFSNSSLGSTRFAGWGLALTAAAIALQDHFVYLPIWMRLLEFLFLLFCAAMLAHGRIAASRPHTDRLTEFYLLLSLGGVFGGALAALAAPVVFNSTIDFQLLLVLALLIRMPRRARQESISPQPVSPRTFPMLMRNVGGWLPLGIAAIAAAATISLDQAKPGLEMWLVGVAMLVALAITSRHPVRYALVIALFLLPVKLDVDGTVMKRERNFFGVITVSQANGLHVLRHGTTLHGSEKWVGKGRGEPTAYYSRTSPIGDALTRLQVKRPFRQVGVIGLGAGAIAAYGEPGQKYTFIEIDPDVVAVAKNPKYFSYLHDSKADVRVLVGDGRLRLRELPDDSLDLLVLDAFSSDAIPVHLLTLEAVQLYRSKLSERGVLMIHVSSNYLDLSPVVARIAQELGMFPIIRADAHKDAKTGQNGSVWMAVGEDIDHLEAFAGGEWGSLPDASTTQLWSDDHVNVLNNIVWGNGGWVL